MKKLMTAGPGINFRIMPKFLIVISAIIISLSFFPGNFSSAYAETQIYETDHIPWSGYWWPLNGCGLGTGGDYFGHPSPLEKYELYTLGFYPSELTSWYREEYCQGPYPGWYGHCGFWSFASLWENMEILPSSIDNIVFRVGDKKGLLTMLHSKDIAAWGDATTPDEFHLWLLKYIKDEKRGFIADMDKGEEVWQYPIYKYIMTSVLNGSTESVHVTVICADDGVDPDFIGIQKRYFNFYYDLFLNEDEEIIGGEWTGDSIIEHPQRMNATLIPGTQAPLLDYDIVREIAVSKDDSLEDGQNNVRLSSGLYNLILLDPDNYFFDPDTGSTVSIHAKLLEGGGSYINAVLIDKNQKIILDQEVTRSESLDLKFLSENPPYLLKLSKSSYDTPGIYTLVYDTFREFSNTIPYVPKDGNWSGFSITNYSDDILKNVELTSYTENGIPIQTLLGPLNMDPRQKMRFIFDSLPYRQRQYSDINSLRISSALNSGTLNLISGRNGGVAEIVQGKYKGAHLVLPDTVMELQPDYYMFGRIINESDFAAALSLTLYNSEGAVQKTVNIDLDSRESYQFIPGQAPFYSMPNNGWMDILSLNQETNLSGFQHIQKDKGVEINFAFPTNESNKIVPHVPFSGKWETELILINTSDKRASMVLHRVMAGMDTSDDVNFEINAKARVIVDLHDILDTSPLNPYYRSILSVSSDQPFTGYYAYQSFDYDDHVTIGLLEESDFSNSLLLSHNTQGNGWWTGVGIFNPGASTINFYIKPYGEDGSLIQGLTTTVSLDTGEYSVFNIAAMFPDHISKITFIRFETEQPADIIGGFHIYGSQEQGMCGANLQKISD